MQKSSVPTRALQDRLDADFYAPAHLRNDAKLASSGIYLSTIGAESEKCNCGATPKRVVYASSGTPLIRGGEIRPCEFRTEMVAKVEGLRVAASSAVAALPGDLVYTMSGACVGDAAVVPDGAGIHCFTNTVVRARFISRTDSRFVAAYLSSQVGYENSRRHSSGGDRGHVMPNVFRRLPVPTPATTCQRYIGSKVRQAEVLREWARALTAEVHQQFVGVHTYDADRRLGSWRRGGDELGDQRLDATFYAPPAVSLTARLAAAGANQVIAYAHLVRENAFNATLPISYFEIGGVDVSTGCAWPESVAAGEAPSRAQRSVQHWDVLVATVRPERKNVGLVAPSAQGQLVASSGFAVLRPASPEIAVFLWGYLRSDAATEQLMRWNMGAAYPAIDDEVALEVLVPDVPRAEMERLGKRWMRIPALLSTARALVTAARLLVEGLIERKVTEAELIAASKDPVADRALLARLAEDGLDGTGRRLFSDLDGLELLLAEATPKP
jgi:type I restriction enzyme S subunit